ncbi:MAG: hypothetical protein ACM31F_04725 [Gemmatimonas sp.]
MPSAFGWTLGSLLLLAIAPAGADSQVSETDSSSRLSVSTDKREYLAEPFHYARPWRTYRYRASVVTTLRNTSSKSVYLQRCDPRDSKPMFELIPVAADESWRNYGTMWACAGNSNPIEVLPGQTRVDTLVIEGPNGHSSSGQVFGRLVGKFRIGLLGRECEDERCTLVDSSRFSNSFDVRPAAGTPSRGASMEGCYMLGFVDWIEPPGMVAPPSRFRLYADAGSQTSNPNLGGVRPLVPLGDSSTAMWAQFGSDSLVVTWRSGFSGYRLHLRPDGGTLFGLLEIFSVDIIRRDRFTDAVARRVECDRTWSR